MLKERNYREASAPNTGHRGIVTTSEMFIPKQPRYVTDSTDPNLHHKR